MKANIVLEGDVHEIKRMLSDKPTKERSLKSKIPAIKYIRNKTGLSIIECKNITNEMIELLFNG